MCWSPFSNRHFLWNKHMLRNRILAPCCHLQLCSGLHSPGSDLCNHYDHGGGGWCGPGEGAVQANHISCSVLPPVLWSNHSAVPQCPVCLTIAGDEGHYWGRGPTHFVCELPHEHKPQNCLYPPYYTLCLMLTVGKLPIVRFHLNGTHGQCKGVTTVILPQCRS